MLVFSLPHGTSLTCASERCCWPRSCSRRCWTRSCPRSFPRILPTLLLPVLATLPPRELPLLPNLLPTLFLRCTPMRFPPTTTTSSNYNYHLFCNYNYNYNYNFPCGCPCCPCYPTTTTTTTTTTTSPVVHHAAPVVHAVPANHHAAPVELPLPPASLSFQSCSSCYLPGERARFYKRMDRGVRGHSSAGLG